MIPAPPLMFCVTSAATEERPFSLSVCVCGRTPSHCYRVLKTHLPQISSLLHGFPSEYPPQPPLPLFSLFSEREGPRDNEQELTR